MAKIGILIEEFSNIIRDKIVEKEILPETKTYKALKYFFKEGNAGVNALREILEEMNEDTVDVFFERDGNIFECHLSICYDYHDIEIVEYLNPNETGIFKTQYKIIDTSRKSIEKIKKGFKTLEI